MDPADLVKRQMWHYPPQNLSRAVDYMGDNRSVLDQYLRRRRPWWRRLFGR